MTQVCDGWAKRGCVAILNLTCGMAISSSQMSSLMLRRLRILDPLLYELLNPSVRRTGITITVKGKQIPGYHYALPFDQRYTSYLLDILLSVIRFGGQGFVKTARTASVKRSHHDGLVQRVESGASNSDILWTSDSPIT